jgi:penicillin-insensitive murein endopeptidase
MRLPTMILGLAALLGVPALLLAQDAGDAGAPKASDAPKDTATAAKDANASEAGKDASEAGKDAAEPGKDAKASETGKDAKQGAKAATVKKVLAKAKPPPPAKELFGAVKTPSPLLARAIGFYAKGCLAGDEALPIDGPAWQHMRLSRNRNWGHPELIALVTKLAVEAKEHDGWPGLLVGDISQPRGGPMLTGHASHQVGLDADVWFTPMPDRRLTQREREDLSATSMLADDRVSVNPKVWTEAHVRLLKRAASYPQVERVLVHPAIKKAVCDAAKDEKDRGWMSKIRAYWGHYYHFHIRIACPKGSTGCQSQPPVGRDDGCGPELTQWLKRIKPPQVAVQPTKPPTPAPQKRPITLDQLPEACRAVLAGGDTPPSAKEAAVADPGQKAAPAPKQAKK